MLPGLSAAAARSDAADRAIADQLERVSRQPLALVALGAYGRRELTPRADVELLFLHAGRLSLQEATERVCYPLWEQHLRVEPLLRTVEECAADARRSILFVAGLLDARLVAGDRELFADLSGSVIEPLRRDRKHIRERLRLPIQQRHAERPSATTSGNPDLLGGRGGLLDAAALRWLAPGPDARLDRARDAFLSVVASLEEQQHEHAATLSDGSVGVLHELYGHARWVAFRLDNEFAVPRADRSLGPHFRVRHGELEGERLPPLETAPALGLRAANLVGYAPPTHALLDWASASGSSTPLTWDADCVHQLWLLLRAADWRAFDFLDVTGLLVRYVPELARVWRHGTDEGALDARTYLALRRLHEWSDSEDPLASRAWRTLRHRDWLYLAVLLHELDGRAARTAAERIGMPRDACDAIEFLAVNHRLLVQTASQRDLHDEDLLLELAAAIGSRQRLRQLFLVSVAHELGRGGEATWTPWQADLQRQLFGRLDALLRAPGEIGARRRRSLEHHRARIVAELERRNLAHLVQIVARLPRRYVLARSPAFVARHLSLLADSDVREGEVRVHAYRHRQRGLWEVLIVARDRPGLLATFAGVLALRGATVLAADAATCSDGLVLDVFTVGSAYGLPLERSVWTHVEADLTAALEGRIPLEDLLGARPDAADAAIRVRVDNAASQVLSLVEVHAPDQVGLLYRIASALSRLALDIHHAKIATRADQALDVFYVWDLAGQKLSPARVLDVEREMLARLRGART